MGFCPHLYTFPLNSPEVNVGQSTPASEADGGMASPRQGGTCVRTPMPPSLSTYQPELRQGWERTEAGERKKRDKGRDSSHETPDPSSHVPYLTLKSLYGGLKSTTPYWWNHIMFSPYREVP